MESTVSSRGRRGQAWVHPMGPAWGQHRCKPGCPDVVSLRDGWHFLCAPAHPSVSNIPCCLDLHDFVALCRPHLAVPTAAGRPLTHLLTQELALGAESQAPPRPPDQSRLPHAWALPGSSLSTLDSTVSTCPSQRWLPAAPPLRLGAGCFSLFASDIVGT